MKTWQKITLALSVILVFGIVIVKKKSSDAYRANITSEQTAKLNSEFTDLKKTGFIDSWKLTNDNRDLNVFVIDSDWNKLNTLQKKEMVRGFLNAFVYCMPEAKKLNIYSYTKEIILAKDGISQVANGENPELY